MSLDRRPVACAKCSVKRERKGVGADSYFVNVLTIALDPPKMTVFQLYGVICGRACDAAAADSGEALSSDSNQESAPFHTSHLCSRRVDRTAQQRAGLPLPAALQDRARGRALRHGDDLPQQ